jgi:hypothetical protein
MPKMWNHISTPPEEGQEVYIADDANGSNIRRGKYKACCDVLKRPIWVLTGILGGGYGCTVTQMPYWRCI